MGVCASCLGLGRPESQSDPSDTSHLLGDPYPPNQYGSLNADQRNGPQVDPEEIRKQRDALERLCAQTTDKLIDVTQTANATDETGTKIASDYSRLFLNRFVPSEILTRPDAEPAHDGDSREENGDSRPSSGSTATDEDETNWLSHVAEEELDQETLGWKATGANPITVVDFSMSQHA